MENKEDLKDIPEGEEDLDLEEAEEEKLEEEEDKTEELDEVKNRLLRLQADFENYKNRVEKEKSNIIKYASEKMMEDLLPILDNFERALEADAEKDSFYEGVELIYGQIIEVLKNNGLKEIDALGQEFDPNYHHAVIMEASDEYDSQVVMAVLQKGYSLNDKVIRPSMVKVSE